MDNSPRRLGELLAVAINVCLLAAIYDQYEQEIHRSIGKAMAALRARLRWSAPVARVSLHIVRQINSDAEPTP